MASTASNVTIFDDDEINDDTSDDNVYQLMTPADQRAGAVT